MYDFKLIEESVLKFWAENDTHNKANKKNAKGKKFYFLQGPPYTSGRLHIGHAWNNSLKDVVMRYKRMCGFNVWDRGGYDMHGLPTENAVQKKLGMKDKLEIEKYGVEPFIKECIKFSSENAKLMDKDLARLGIWMDFKNAYWPIKNEFIEGEWWLIKKAWDQKRLYKGKKIMQWCASCETSLAKHELEYENVKDKSIYVQFKLKDKDGYLAIWTTTPWTIPFNLAVMVNPELDYVKLKTSQGDFYVAKALADNFKKVIGDEKAKVVETIKGKKMEGWEYIHPFSDSINYNELKKNNPNVHTVILSKEYVTTEAGTGLVHCAPGCGPEDYEVGIAYNIPAFNIVDEQGIFKDAGEFNGLIAKKDDWKFIKAIDDRRALLAEEKVEHEYAHCWRCHNPVIFRSTEQWFMKIEDLIPKMLQFNKSVNWVPESASKNFDLWVENLKDNGISRQRYWGCPVPIWECESCKNIEVIESREEIKKLGGKVPADLHKPWIDAVKLKCPKCKSQMSRVPDVIDVWIDSGTASWNCLEYPANKKYFSIWPADFILEATEQIRLWFSMLQICSAVAFGKSCYKNVYCHGMILDYQGMKMSKSLGNVISPYEVVDKYGADILRYYMCEVNAGENINFSWEDVKIKQRNLNIFDNVSRFILDLKTRTKPNKKFDIEEKYILSRKNSTIKKVTELMDEYRIDEVIKEIENLFLDLSRVYIRITRDKANSEDAGKVLAALEEVYLDTLKMFAIIAPFISDYLYRQVYDSKGSIHLTPWPKSNPKLIDKKLEEEFSVLSSILEKGFAERDKIQIGLKWPLAGVEITSSNKLSKDFEELLKSQLNVKKVNFKASKNQEIQVLFDSNITPELEAEGYSREISRQIQAFRKKLGLEKKDLVDTYIITDSNFKKILENNLSFIKERTNSKKLELIIDDKSKHKETFKNKEPFKIKDKIGEIAIVV